MSLPPRDHPDTPYPAEILSILKFFQICQLRHPCGIFNSDPRAVTASKNSPMNVVLSHLGRLPLEARKTFHARAWTRSLLQMEKPGLWV